MSFNLAASWAKPLLSLPLHVRLIAASVIGLSVLLTASCTPPAAEPAEVVEEEEQSGEVADEILEEILEDVQASALPFEFSNNLSAEFIQGDCWDADECWARWFITYNGNEQIEMIGSDNFSGELGSLDGDAKIIFFSVIDLEEQWFAQESHFIPGKRYQLVVQAKTRPGTEYFSASLRYLDIPLIVPMECFVAAAKSDPAPEC
jgi:hypothetical protein